MRDWQDSSFFSQCEIAPPLEKPQKISVVRQISTDLINNKSREKGATPFLWRKRVLPNQSTSVLSTVHKKSSRWDPEQYDSDDDLLGTILGTIEGQ